MKSSDSEKKKLKAKACYVPNNNDQVDVPTDNTINPIDNDNATINLKNKYLSFKKLFKKNLF